jgi:hypothetical protein
MKRETVRMILGILLSLAVIYWLAPDMRHGLGW